MDTLIYVYNIRDPNGLAKLNDYINQIHALNQANAAYEQNHHGLPVVLVGIIGKIHQNLMMPLLVRIILN